MCSIIFVTILHPIPPGWVLLEKHFGQRCGSIVRKWMRCAIASIPKCVVLVNEELHALADFLSFLLGAYRRAVQCSIVREGLLHLPQVCLPETPAVLRILLAIASGSCSRESRCLDELLEVAAYDLRKGVVETPELTELDFRFLFLLSEHSTIC